MRKSLRIALAVAVAATFGLGSPAPAQAAPNNFLAIPDAGNYEGQNVTFTLTYTGPTAATFEVLAIGATSGGTAESGAALTAGVPATAAAAGADFVNGPGLTSSSFNPSTRSITFPASSSGAPSTATVSVVTGADADTADETFTLHAALAGGPDVTAIGRIWALPSAIPAFTYVAPSTVPEGQATVTVTATLAPGGVQAHDVIIPVTTGVGTTPTATSTGALNRDYTALPAGSQIVIRAGQLTGSIDVSLWDDNVYEGVTQNLKVVTGTPFGAIGPASVEIGLVDNDSVPAVSIGDAPAVAEGAPSVFPVRLSSLSDLAVTVTVTTVSGSDTSTSHGATNGLDYTIPAAKLTIPALTRTATVTVKTILDYNVEGTETFVAALSVPVNATLGTPAAAIGTITDDLTKPTVTRVAPTAALNGKTYVAGDLVNAFVEGETGERATFINLSIAATTNPIPRQLKYSFVDGTALNGVDYRGTAGSVTVPAGAGVIAVQIPVTIIGDRIYDPAEGFTVALTSPNGTINPNSLATPMAFTILETGGSQPTWATGNISVAEGNSGTTLARVPIKVTGATSAAVTFTAVLADVRATEAGINAGTTVGADDYNLPAALSVTVAAGATTAYLEVPVNGDAVYERDESFTVTFTQVGTAFGDGPAGATHVSQVVITNDDAAPTVSFNQLISAEGSTIRVTGATTGLSQYDYALGFALAPTGANPATAGLDYVVAAGPQLSAYAVPRGSQGPFSTMIASVDLLPDDIDEATETFGVTATETTPASIGIGTTTPAPIGIVTTTGVYRIGDDPDDLPPTASIGAAIVKESAGMVDVPVSLAFAGDTVSSSQPFTLSYATVNGTAVAPADYQETQGVLTIPAGTLTSKISVPIAADGIAEPVQKFSVRIDTPGPAGATLGNDTGEVSIESDGVAAVPLTITVLAAINGALSVRINGTAGKRATVELWSAPFTGGELKMINTGVADAAGRYSFLRWIGVGTRFQVRSEGVSSAVKSVRINQMPLFAAASGGKGKLTLTVLGNPAGRGQAVVVQRSSNDKWVTAWTGVTGPDNKWTATVGAKSKSSWTLRALVAGSVPAGINSGYSAVKRITVK